MTTSSDPPAPESDDHPADPYVVFRPMDREELREWILRPDVTAVQAVRMVADRDAALAAIRRPDLSFDNLVYLATYLTDQELATCPSYDLEQLSQGKSVREERIRLGEKLKAAASELGGVLRDWPYRESLARRIFQITPIDPTNTKKGVP